MECLVCEDLDPRWNEYVLGHAQGTFFHLLEWRDVIRRNFNYRPLYLYAAEGNRYVGVLPLFFVKSLLFGRSLVTLPLAVYGGIVAENEEIRDSLFRHAIELGRELGVSYVEFRGNPHSNGSAFPAAKWSVPFKERDLYVTFLREIDPDPEVNLSQVPRKQRRMIRQGQKHGLRSVMDDSRLSEFYGVYAASVRNLGTPVYSYEYFSDLKQTFSDHCKLLLVEHEGETIAGVLSFFHKNQVLPYYGGSLPERRELAPNDFMYWELMSYGALNGYRVFDFGRSKKESGSFHFKRHWGFEPLALPYFYCVMNGKPIPDTSSLNPKLQWAVKLWRRLPLALTTTLGPKIVRHIP